MKYLIDTHTHTVASGHAYSTLLENLKWASEVGLTMMATTDHAPKMKNTTSAVFFPNLSILPDEMYGVQILKGVELNILDEQGEVDLKEDILKKLDIAIASIHAPYLLQQSEKVITKAYLNAMDNPYIDILGHLGDLRFPVDCHSVMKKAKETGTLIEMNNASLYPGGFRAGSDVVMKELLTIAKKEKMPVTLGSDAHFVTKIGDFTLVDQLLSEMEFPMDLVLNSEPERLLATLKRNQ
ncbi:MAG: phosphatase [Bacillota bacterium]